MADDLFIPDRSEGTAPASRDNLFIPDQPSYDDSNSPETDKALAETSLWEKAIRLSPMGAVNEYNKAVTGLVTGTGFGKSLLAAAKTPSPPWMQPIEKGIRDVATYQIPGVAEANPLYWASRYNQEVAKYLPRPLSTAAETSGALGVGLTKGVASMATPMNIGLAVLPGAAEGMAGKALAGLFTGQAMVNTPEQVERIKQDYAKGDTAAAIQHSAELAGSYLPGLHFFGGKGPPPKGPVKTGPTALTPEEFIQKYKEAPEDLSERGEPFAQPGPKGFTGTKEEPYMQPETAKAQPQAGLSEEEAKVISTLQEKLQKGDITPEEYRSKASEALKVGPVHGEQPVVSDGTYNYKFDPESDRWHMLDEEGKPFRVLSQDEFPEGTPQHAQMVDLINKLADQRDQVMEAKEAAVGGIEAKDKTGRVVRTGDHTYRYNTRSGKWDIIDREGKSAAENDLMAEKRARQAMEGLKTLGGHPDAVLQDLIDTKGSEPTWGEFADALEADIKHIAPTPEAAARVAHEATARRRGMTVKQLDAERAAHQEDLLAKSYQEAQDAIRSRQELIEEQKDKGRGKGKGGRYAVKPSYEEVPARPPALGVKEGGGGPLTRPGGGDYVERETEGGPPGREVPRVEKRDKELENRAIHNIETRYKLPKNKAELVKLQEGDPEAWPSMEEISKMEDLEYMKLLREKRAAQKASQAAEKKETAPAAEEKLTEGVTPVVKEAGETGVRPGVVPGKPAGGGEHGLRETILNARELGLTREQYQKWREGSGPDFAMDADSITARKKALGITEEPPEEPPPAAAPEPAKPVTPPGAAPAGKTFKVRSALDDYANSAETPVATEISNMGGLKSKTAAQKQGVYEGNEAQWDDVPKLAHPTHRKIYNPNGEMPDVAAQALYDRGLIKESSVREMNRELEKESASLRARIEAAPEKGTEGKVKQAEKFGEGQRSEIESGTKAVPAESLKEGDKVNVDGTELKVTKVDKNGEVTLEDGTRYGAQEVAGDEVIYGEVEAPGKTEKPAPVTEERFSTKKNFKKVADSRYEHKDTKLIISKGKEGGWDIRHPTTGEVIDNQPTRQKAMQAYAEGQTVSVGEQASKLKLRANKEGGYTTLIPDALDFGKRLYRKGMSYARWSADMVKHLGKAIKDHLKGIWEDLTGGKFRPGFKEGGGMRSGPLPRGRGFGKPIQKPVPEEKPAEPPPQEPSKYPAGRGFGVPKGEPKTAPTLKDAMQAANRRLERNPARADQLVKELISGKRIGVDGIDEAILVQHKAVLQGARDRAGQDTKNMKLSQGERAEAAATFQDQEKQLRDLEYATNDGAMFQEKGQSRLWHTFKAKDYNSDSMKQKLYVAKGGVDVTPEEMAKMQTHIDRLSDMMAKEAARKIATGWRPGATRDPVLRDIQWDAFQAKKALDDTIFKAQFETSSLSEKGFHYAWQVMAIPRAIMASTDLSAIRRQGGILFMSHPIRSMKIFGDMMRASKSDRAYFDLMQDIRERPNAQLYAASKLGLTDVTSPKLSQLEEQYMSQWADKIPIVAGSQRAYVYYLNRLRADTFDAMAMTLTRKGVPTAKQAAIISNMINVFTGRGTIPGQYANSIALLNNAFFAPRYVLSRFQAITGQPIRFAIKNDPAMVKLIAGEYARALIGYGVVYGLVGTALKGYATVEWDPKSTDFGKIKIGNTRVDIMSGLSQPTVFLARSAPEILGLGKTKTSQGKVMSLRSSKNVPMTQRTYSDVLVDFVRGKLAPLPAAFINVKQGKTVVGEPTDLTSELWKMVLPMSGNDIYKSLRDYGLSKESALTLLTIFGDSVQTYSTKATGRSRHHHRARSY